MKRLLALGVLAYCATVTAQEITLPDYERVVLDNGAVLLLAEKHDVPLIGLQAVVRGGDHLKAARSKQAAKPFQIQGVVIHQQHPDTISYCGLCLG